MKIAINLTRESVGGITSSNLNLINYLYQLDCKFVGIELTKEIYMKGPTIFRPFSPDVFDHHIINIHHIPLMESLKKSKTFKDLERMYSKPIEIVRSILRSTRPEVILLSGTYYLPWIISIAARKEGVPIVLWYSGVLSKETEHYPKKLKKLFSQMERSIVRNAEKIIFPSTLCKQTVEEMVTKAKIKNCYVIPNPVARIFSDPCAADASIERRIAAIGRFSRVKNFRKFFDLHLELKKRKWRHTASFVTSTSTSTLDKNLEKMPKTIELLPPMTADGLREFYLSQGLIVCPSTFETFGNVPMEAVCLGIPVLVSETMGCAEILRKVGLENMVMSFSDIGKVAERAISLCGQSILPRQTNALKRILDNNLISEEIRAVINSVVK